MTKSKDNHSMEPLSLTRLRELLDQLAGQGLTQQQIATKAFLPAQYLSDIKAGRRPMTELVARRLGEAFGVPHEWLSGIEDSVAGIALQPAAAYGGAALWLPLFPHPIQGEPRRHPDWDGTGVEISSVAARTLALAKEPYVLRFGNEDLRGRLQKGDFVLVSQSVSPSAEISVVRHGKKLFLARLQNDGTWQRLAMGTSLPMTASACGHCLGIIWSALQVARP